MGDRPVAVHVIIPAHNEEQVIQRCLNALFDGDSTEADVLDLHVTVVSNGSMDRTAARARECMRPNRSLNVCEIEKASKIAAIRVGSQLASAGTIVLLDADVKLAPGTLAAIAALLAEHPSTVAAPPAVVDSRVSPWPVRRYYRVWATLPYVRTDIVGSGVLGLGAQARTVLASLPDVTNDDAWICRSFAPSSRLRAGGACTVYAPRTTRALLGRLARVVAGSMQLDDRFGASGEGRSGQRKVLLTGLRAREFSLLDALTYAVISKRAIRMGRGRRRRGDQSWASDLSSRGAVPTDAG